MRVYKSLLLISFIICSFSASSQTWGRSDKVCYYPSLGSGFIDVLKNALYYLEENNVKIYLGSDTVCPSAKHHPIPKSAYKEQYKNNELIEPDLGMYIANFLSVNQNRISFKCKKNLLIDDEEIIFSISVNDLKSMDNESYAKKILYNFFYECYFQKLGQTDFNFIDWDYTENLLHLAANEFLKNQSKSSSYVSYGYTEEQTNKISDSIYTDKNVELRYFYNVTSEAFGLNFSLEKVGFSFVKFKGYTSGLELPRHSYFVEVERLEAFLGKAFSYFIIEGIKQSYLQVINVSE